MLPTPSGQLTEHLTSLYGEPEIYRLDHYLGKEMVQKLLLFRFSNMVFSSLWSHKHIEAVVITFKDPFGVRGAGAQFDQVGILRDVLQNHLLQVLSLVAMEQPASSAADHVRDAKVHHPPTTSLLPLFL